MVLCVSHLLLIASSVSMIIVSLSMFFGYKPKKKKAPFLIACAVFAAVSVCMSLLLKEGETAESMHDFLQILSNMSLPYFLFKSGRKSTFALFGFVMPSFSDIICSAVASRMSNMTNEKLVLIYIVCYFLITVLVMVLSRVLPVKFSPDFLETIPVFVYIAIFIFLLSNYYGMQAGQDAAFSATVAKVLRILSSAFVIVSIIVVVMRYISALNTQKEYEKQLDAEIRHYEEMMRKNGDIRAFRHDYKNNLFSLNALMSGGKTEEAQQYISELSQALENTKNSFQTGNYLADAILSDKAEAAAQSGTKIDFSGTIPKDWIKNSDLCTVLSNSLDNAVRACGEIPDAVISVKCKETDNSAVISISNPVLKKVEIKNNRIKTTKADSLNHGIGLANVEKTARKYDGYMKLSCDDSVFEIKTGFIKQ
ncbi:MAG: GHKL domain-containing protein [Clostridia bacterium]|nr:GHKL domain-containing protein [Clostridia bacterium]